MSCSGGRLCLRVCSASSASLIQVRAMSLRVACTRGFGAPSANFSHSAARSLQSSEFIFKDRLRVQLHTAGLDRVRRLRLRPEYLMLGATCIRCFVALPGSRPRHGQEPRLAKSPFLDQTLNVE
jgi:hypothetical protein